METIVCVPPWFSGTRGGSLNKEVERRPWFGGTQGGSLNKDVEWRPWYSGTQGGKFK